MSIFGTKYNKDEQRLLEVYIELLIMKLGGNRSQAKQVAEELLKKCIKVTNENGTYNIPMNFGDVLLGEAELDNPVYKSFADKMKELLPEIKDEGVTDVDIRWWWNMSEVERRMTRELDSIPRMNTFMHFLEEGLEPPQAAIKVKTMFPIYGSADGDPQLKGEDRRLPEELKKRVNDWTITKMQGDPEDYKKAVEKAGSLNAYIRLEMRNGNL